MYGAFVDFKYPDRTTWVVENWILQLVHVSLDVAPLLSDKQIVNRATDQLRNIFGTSMIDEDVDYTVLTSTRIYIRYHGTVSGMHV